MWKQSKVICSLFTTEPAWLTFIKESSSTANNFWFFKVIKWHTATTKWSSAKRYRREKARIIALETQPHPSLPGGPVCVGLGLIAAETSNTAVDPHIFSCSVEENGDIKTHETSRRAGRVPIPEIGPKIILPGLTANSHGATERGITRRENPIIYRRPTPSLTAKQPGQVGAGREITTFKPEPTASLSTDARDKDSNRAGSVAGFGLKYKYNIFYLFSIFSTL